MKKYFAAMGTVALFAAAMVPAFAATNNCSNGTTGPFSTDYCNINNTSNVSVTNDNKAKIVNDISGSATTGNNTASYNTLGGKVMTGNASLNTTVSNVANINTTNVTAGMTGASNTAGNEITGPYSDNRVAIDNSQSVDVLNKNRADITNNVTSTSDTGSNATDYNTGFGDVRTGNAMVNTMVGTHANDSQTTVTGAGTGAGSNTVVNDTTGPFSTDYATITNDAAVKVRNINDMMVSNWVETAALTGANSSSYGTLGGSVGTGNARNSVGVNTEGNINTTAVAMSMGGFGGGSIAGNSITGPFSDARDTVSNNQDISVDNLNNSCSRHSDFFSTFGDWGWGGGCDNGIFNTDYSVTDTGSNAADYNTGFAGVGTGLSDIVKMINSHMNDSLTVIK